jgi:hypothetical protein
MNKVSFSVLNKHFNLLTDDPFFSEKAKNFVALVTLKESSVERGLDFEQLLVLLIFDFISQDREQQEQVKELIKKINLYLEAL